MTAGIAIALGLLLGAGLVISQLMRLRAWLAKAPPELPPQRRDDDDDNDDGAAANT